MTDLTHCGGSKGILPKMAITNDFCPFYPRMVSLNFKSGSVFLVVKGAQVYV